MKKNKVFRYLLIISTLTLFVLNFSIAFADTNIGKIYENPAKGVDFRGAEGGKQNYYKTANNIVYIHNNELYVSNKGNTESIISIHMDFFVSANRIIGYGGGSGDASSYWWMYDLNSKKLTKLTDKYLKKEDNPFWSDSNGVFYTKNASNTVYYFNFKTKKSNFVVKSPGQPIGIINEEVISISFSQRQVFSSKSKKNKVVYQGAKDLISAEVVNEKIYITRLNGFYEVNLNGEIKKLFDEYTVFASVCGDKMIWIQSLDESQMDLMHGFRVLIADDQKYADLEIPSDSNFSIMSPHINHDGTEIVFWDYILEIEMTAQIPPYTLWKNLP